MVEITRRDFLKMAGAVAIGFLGGSILNHFTSKAPSQETKSPQYNKNIPQLTLVAESEATDYVSIEGLVEDVDEDEFLVYLNSSFAGGASSIPFEIYRISKKTSSFPKNYGGPLLTLIYPGPQSINVGDGVRLTYKPYDTRKISTEDILNNSGFPSIVNPDAPKSVTDFQKKDIIADGLIKDMYRE